MKIQRIRVLGTFLLCFCFLFTVANPAFAKVTKSNGASGLLHEAVKLLSEADHDYNGHRAEAVKQVHLALEEIKGKTAHPHNNTKTNVQTAHVHKTMVKAKGGVKGNEPQPTSDSQLRQAESILQQASGEVSGAALQHVSAAIAQINTALSIR